MAQVKETLARFAGSILVAVGGLLAVGALLTVVGQPVVGMPVYGAGYAGTLVAFPALIVIGRRSLGRVARVGLATLMAGIVLGIPVMLMMLGFYVQNAQLHDLFMPYVLTPLGMLAGPIAWLGLAVFGIAAVRDGALPAATGALFAAAPVLALPVELEILPPVAWAIAFLMVGVGLAWVALRPARQIMAVTA